MKPIKILAALLMLALLCCACSAAAQEEDTPAAVPFDEPADVVILDENGSMSMAEAGKSVSDYLGSGERIVYVEVMNRLSIDCDCDGNPAEPDLHDIGILASADPVALDQACIDLVYAQKDGDGASLVSRIESRNGLHTLEYAEEIGLGSRQYTLVSVDD